jgi:beta-N-acetylhexosaminidase
MIMNYLLPLLFTLGLSSHCVAGMKQEVSLHNKIGQMLLIGFDGKQINSQSKIVKIIEKDNIGGVILFDYNEQTKTFDKNIESPAQVKQLNHELQSKSKF